MLGADPGVPPSPGTLSPEWKRAGHLGLVVGTCHHDYADGLRAHGAGVVVTRPGSAVERQLSRGLNGAVPAARGIANATAAP